jgi:hypothetical protein
MMARTRSDDVLDDLLNGTPEEPRRRVPVKRHSVADHEPTRADSILEELLDIDVDELAVDDTDTTYAADLQRAIAELAPELANLDDPRRRFSRHTRPRHRVRRVIVRTSTTLVVGAALAVGAVAWAIANGYLQLPSAAAEVPPVATITTPVPHSTSILDLPIYNGPDPEWLQLLEGPVGAYAEAAVIPLEDRLDDTPPASDSPTPGDPASPSEGTGTDTATPTAPPSSGSSGGTTTTTTPKITTINGQSFSGVGRIDLEVYVTTANGSVPISATASVPGYGSITLNGPGSLDGTTTYTGAFNGLPEGDYTVTIHVNDKTLNLNAPVF